MKLLNNPKSIIGRYIYYEGCPYSRRRILRLYRWSEYGCTIISENDDGTENSGPFEAYTLEPFRDAPRLTLQDLQ